MNLLLLRVLASFVKAPYFEILISKSRMKANTRRGVKIMKDHKLGPQAGALTIISLDLGI